MAGAMLFYLRGLGWAFGRRAEDRSGVAGPNGGNSVCRADRARCRAHVAATTHNDKAPKRTTSARAVETDPD
jgi:hypothetical protein